MGRAQRSTRVVVAALLIALTACTEDGGSEAEGVVAATDPAVGSEATVSDRSAGSEEAPDASFDHLAELPVNDGLVVGFLADSGVETDDRNNVTSWADLTGTLTLAPAEAEPRLIEAGHRGRDTIRFEGTAREMSAPGIEALPSGNTDRTVIVAGDFQSGAAGSTSQLAELQGVGWGDPQTSGANYFTGNVHYNCFSLNLPGVMTGLGDPGSTCFGQVLAELTLGDTSLRDPDYISMATRVKDGRVDLLYRDRVDESSDWTFETDPRRFWIGGWPGAEGISTFDVVAVLVYDRALGDAEITEVVEHLRAEYGVDG